MATLGLATLLVPKSSNPNLAKWRDLTSEVHHNLLSSSLTHANHLFLFSFHSTFYSNAPFLFTNRFYFYLSFHRPLSRLSRPLPSFLPSNCQSGAFISVCTHRKSRPGFSILFRLKLFFLFKINILNVLFFKLIEIFNS